MMMATHNLFVFTQLSPNGSAHTEHDDAQTYMQLDAWQVSFVSADEVSRVLMLYDDEEVRNVFGRRVAHSRCDTVY